MPLAGFAGTRPEVDGSYTGTERSPEARPASASVALPWAQVSPSVLRSPARCPCPPRGKGVEISTFPRAETAHVRSAHTTAKLEIFFLARPEALGAQKAPEIRDRITVTPTLLCGENDAQKGPGGRSKRHETASSRTFLRPRGGGHLRSAGEPPVRARHRRAERCSRARFHQPIGRRFCTMVRRAPAAVCFPRELCLFLLAQLGHSPTPPADTPSPGGPDGEGREHVTVRDFTNRSVGDSANSDSHGRNGPSEAKTLQLMRRSSFRSRPLGRRTAARRIPPARRKTHGIEMTPR